MARCISAERMADARDAPPHVPEPDDGRLGVLGHRITAFPLPAAGTVALGRDPAGEIAIDDAQIAPLHARLTCDRLAIEDLGSAAGTWVRRARLAPGAPAALACDEVFQLGPIAMVV
jgi:hypothetical protein